MPNVKCDWDCCKHFNTETGYCDNPNNVVLETEEMELIDERGRVTDNKLELFNCISFESYEEGEGK